MKRKYSDPLVYSGILLEGGTIHGTISQGGGNPGEEEITEDGGAKIGAEVNAPAQVIQSAQPEITLVPADGGSAEDPAAVEAPASPVEEIPSVIEEMTGEEPAPDITN